MLFQTCRKTKDDILKIFIIFSDFFENDKSVRKW